MMGGSHSMLGVGALAFSYFFLWIGVDMACAQVASQESDSHTQLVVMLSGNLGSEQTFGAGIIVGREKNRLYIATANHVVRKGQEETRDLQVRLKPFPQKFLKANILKQVDSELDLAVLSVKGTNADEIEFCALRMDRVSLTSAKRGDAVYPVGNPNGVPWVMPAVPDRVAQVVGDHVMVQSTVISVGHSGGALLDESSNVIGMITADQPPFGRVVKIDVILKIVHQWGYPVQLRVQLAKGWMPLHEAAYHGDATAIKNLLADTCRVDVNARTDHGSTPLHYATKHVDIIPVLLSAGADLHATDKDGDTPLNWAAESGQLKSAELLMKAGAKIDSQIKEQMTALHWAVQNGHPAIVQAMILAGADVNAVAQFRGRGFLVKDTPLGKAVEKGDVEIVKMLLKAGAKVDAAIKGTATPVAVAVQKNKVELVKILLAAGADVNVLLEGDRYPREMLLHHVAQNGPVEVLELLLKAGATVNATNSNEETPLHAVARSKSVEGVKFLLAAGADVSAINNDGLTPLHIAVANSTAEVVNILVAAGADINAKVGNWTPLLSAVERRAVEIAKVLIKAGANVNVKLSSQYAPLYYAVKHGDTELATALLKAGADVNWVDPYSHHTLLAASPTPAMTKVLLEEGADVNSGEGAYGTALHVAARDEHVAQMELLLAKGASLDSTDFHHETPLHHAVQWPHGTETVKFLLTMGAKVNVAAKDGHTPLHDAVKSTQEATAPVVRFLIEAKAEINVKDRNGDTPLHNLAGIKLQSERANAVAKEVAELLIMNGADINATNSESKTPLAIAIDKENITLTRLLRSHGAK